MLGVCLPAASLCATSTSVLADTTAPVIMVLLNSMSVNATTPRGQTLVVTTVYVGGSTMLLIPACCMSVCTASCDSVTKVKHVMFWPLFL